MFHTLTVEPYTSYLRILHQVASIIPGLGHAAWRGKCIYQLWKPHLTLCVHSSPPMTIIWNFSRKTSGNTIGLLLSHRWVWWDHSINKGQGQPVFWICGELCHKSGALVPSSNNPPWYAQLYIYEPRVILESCMVQNQSLSQNIMQGFRICSFNTISMHISSNMLMKYFVIMMAPFKMQKFIFVLCLGSINGYTIFQLQMKLPWFCWVHNPKHLAISYFATVMDHYIRLVTSILPMLLFNIRSSFLGVKWMARPVLHEDTQQCERQLWHAQQHQEKQNEHGLSNVWPTHESQESRWLNLCHFVTFASIASIFTQKNLVSFYTLYRWHVCLTWSK